MPLRAARHDLAPLCKGRPAQGRVRRALLAAGLLATAGCDFPVWAQSGSPGAQTPPASSLSRNYPVNSPAAASILAIVREPAVSHAHWGVAVAALDGTPLFGLDEAKLFHPASTAKLFTTAAALALLGPSQRFRTAVLASGTVTDGTLTGDLILRGGGDSNFAGPYALPYRTPAEVSVAFNPDVSQAPPRPPLADIDDLAGTLVAGGLRHITGDVVGDDTRFPDERYPEGWAIEDMLPGYGAPVSALTVHDNAVELTLTPGPDPGVPAAMVLTPALPYLHLIPAPGPDATAGTPGVRTASGLPRLLLTRQPGSPDLYVAGHLPAGSPVHESVAIEDPAAYAALALHASLVARGVLVDGAAHARHRPPTESAPSLAATWQPPPAACPAQTSAVPGPLAAAVLAEHPSPTLGDDLRLTNKLSDNLHAELLLRNLGAEKGCDGSARDGLQLVRHYWLRAGLDPDDFAFFDGSGLSNKDLVTPRSLVSLLSFAAAQPWFPLWKATLPVGGVDGTLASRFTGSALRGRVVAKTGTLGEARALAGYLTVASGRTLVFAVLVDNHTPAGSVDRLAMDRIVAAIAAAY